MFPVKLIRSLPSQIHTRFLRIHPYARAFLYAGFLLSLAMFARAFLFLWQTPVDLFHLLRLQELSASATETAMATGLVSFIGTFFIDITLRKKS